MSAASSSIPYKSVRMIRRDLDGIPPVAVPPGYLIRPYRSGDQAAWLAVHHECYDAKGQIAITPELYQKNFGTDDRVLAERQLFLCDRDGMAVGSITGWWADNYYGERFGQIHWVAIVPACQGRGLAKPLLAAGMNRLRALGHTNAWLGTQTTRVPAINLYLQFGFMPDIRTAEDQASWDLVRPYLKSPAR